MQWHIGTSGYHYDDWKGAFYPEKMKKADWLPFYAEHFNTVEINNTFYGTPSPKTLNRWYESTPSDFEFTVKGNRYVTHIKRLLDPKQGVNNMYKTIEPLKEKTRCILWQLPASIKYNHDRLVRFADACSRQYVNVIEFRDPSWFTDEVMDILRKEELTFCMISAPDNLPETATTTTDTAYLRFHGKKEWYRHLYSEKEILHWVRKVSGTRAKEVYVYFNNDYETHAITNARQLRQMVS